MASLRYSAGSSSMAVRLDVPLGVTAGPAPSSVRKKAVCSLWLLMYQSTHDGPSELPPHPVSVAVHFPANYLLRCVVLRYAC